MKRLSQAKFKLYLMSKKVTDFLDKSTDVNCQEVVDRLNKQLQQDLEKSKPDLSDLDENSFIHKYLYALGFWEEPGVQYKLCKLYPKLLNLL